MCEDIAFDTIMRILHSLSLLYVVEFQSTDKYVGTNVPSQDRDKN